MPWKRELLGTFLSFCPIVTQNPTLVHGVSVPPCLPCAARVDLLMGWERRGQDVSKLVLHAKQVYLMAQGLNPSSSTPSDTFLTNPKSPSPTLGLGVESLGQTMLQYFHC